MGKISIIHGIYWVITVALVAVIITYVPSTPFIFGWIPPWYIYANILILVFLIWNYIFLTKLCREYPEEGGMS